MRVVQPARRRVLVTGGAGFIGSHLCERLLNEKAAVLCLDNFQTGRRSNIAHLIGRDGFKLIEHDISVPFETDVDEIYNLACPASPRHYQADPIQTTKTSILGAINMLDLAEACGARILQASTSEVYGDPLVHPQPETYWGNVNPIGPRACYDEGKRAAETLFLDYHRRRGVSVKIARIFNTYGPRMQPDDGRVVSNFIVQALARGRITIYGTGAQTRSFCYVDDTLDGLMRLMATPDEITGPVNIGHSSSISILRLAEKVRALTASAVPIDFVAPLADDPRDRQPDIGLAARLLGWAPTTTLDEGLARTIAHFDALMATERTM